MENHLHPLAVSTVQASWSACARQGSPALPASGAQVQAPHAPSPVHEGQTQVLAVLPVPAGAPEATEPVPTQPQPQVGQLSPAGQSGQAQAQVPWETQPASAPELHAQ